MQAGPYSPSSGPLERLLPRLANVRRSGKGWSAQCPGHEDGRNSLSVGQGPDGRVLLNCFAGCQLDAILGPLGMRAADLFFENGRGKGGHCTPPSTGATAQPPGGCTLQQYADAKRLPSDFLRELGLSDIYYLGQPAVRIPYLDSSAIERAVQFRLALAKSGEGDDRFRFKSGHKPIPYGLWRLDAARTAGRVALVEGPSDCHTLWHHDIPALGIPGAGNWQEAWSAHLDGIARIDVVIEPDQGGEAVRAWLAKSRLRERAWLVELGALKDASGLYLDDPDRFRERWQTALDAATPWTEQAQAAAEAQQAEAWARCAALAQQPRILDHFALALETCGVVGERRAAKLLYLVGVSRLLARPVSAVVKGPSSAGKSHLTERVLQFFPRSAYYALSAMSERALAYSDEPLAHRILVVYEAVGIEGDFASYLVRSLLSEGRVRYETVEKTREGLRPRLIEREGPTGLIVTTTKAGLHPENETRLLSIPVTDSREQTHAVLMALATEDVPTVDLAPWHALQTSLEMAEHRVTIPYAKLLAESVSPLAVRLRRDFGALLNLIRAHAVLQQASRERDAAGRIIATLDDYAAVRELVAELIADGVEAAVSASTRETVEAVATILAEPGIEETTIVAVASRLKLDKSSASRRVRVALERGYLRNLEDRKGRPARLVLGELLPEDQEILPTVETLAAQVAGCAVAVVTPGVDIPPSPLDGAASESVFTGQPYPCVICATLLPFDAEFCPTCDGIGAEEDNY